MPSGYDPNDTLTAIYGVDFPSYRNSPGNTTNASLGVRTYAAKDMTLEIAKAIKHNAAIATTSASSSIKVGHDDFVGKGPFKIRECVTSLGSDGKQHVMAYKDDRERLDSSNPYPWYNSTYAQNTSYNTMIEFPKFYYRRPSPYEFQVSSTKHEGFECSPMHYRENKEYDYCYISKYLLQTPNYYSYCSTTNANSSATNPETVRKALLNKGLRMFDYKCFYSLAMLMLIKYAVLDVSRFIGVGHQTTTITNSAAPCVFMYLQSNPATRYCTEANCGVANSTAFTGYGASNVTLRAYPLTLGLETYYSNLWTTMDGLYYYNSALWVSKDPTTLKGNNMTVADITNASNFDSLYLNIRDLRASGTDSLSHSGTTLAYFPNYPYLLIPTSTTSNNSGIGDIFFYKNVTTPGGTTLPQIALGCGHSAMSLNAGPLAIDLATSVSHGGAEHGDRSFFVASES